MKKIVKYLLLLILMSPIYTYALSYANYNDSIKAVNSYINRYSDRNKYIMFDAKYDFTNGMPTTNTDFKKGGLLTRDEYLLSKGKNTSYLTMGKEFWTMTENVNNQHFYIDYDILSKSNGAYSGVRVTEYVKPETEVGGKGSYSNPWVFLLSYKINLKVNSSKYGSVDPEIAHVKPNSKLGNIEITEKPGYSYDNNDCGLVFVRNKDTFTNIYETKNITRDTTCIINFAKRKVEISYSCNGGTNPPSSQTVTYGNQYSIAGYDICKRDGYNQTGWVTDNGNAWEAGNYDKFEVENGQRGVSNNKLKLKAVWNANNYVVTLDKNGGTGGTDSYNATYNQMVQNVTIPLKAGYKFTSYTLNTKVYHNETGVGQRKYDETSASTFKANYEKCLNIGYEYVSEWQNNNNCEIKTCKPGFDLINNTCVGKTLTATFNKNGATSIGSSSVSCTIADESEKCSIVLPSITRSGFTIDGWNNSASATSGTAVGSTVTLTANTTYYAITHKAVTITFNRNGNTSQTPSGGSASTANSVTQSCTIRNSATTCSITSPKITAPSGYNVIGYSKEASVHTSSWDQNKAQNVSTNEDYFAQSSKAAVDGKVTFNPNGNTSFTYGETNYTTATAITICQIPAAYNGATQGTTCSATITMPTITAASGFTPLGWSNASATHTATYTSGQANVTLTSGTTWFAQSSMAGKTITVTFDRNKTNLYGTKQQTKNGSSTASTDDSITDSCTTATVYNGASQSTSCSITSPEIGPHTGYSVIGYNTSSTATTSDWNHKTAKSVSSNTTYYSITKMNKPAKPTIDNPKEDKWTNADISITVSTSTTSSIIGKWYYKYGSGNWTEWSGRDGKSSETYTEKNEKNTTVYFKVCNSRATGESDTTNCSDAASSKVKIDKTAPNPPSMMSDYNSWSTGVRGTWQRPYCIGSSNSNCSTAASTCGGSYDFGFRTSTDTGTVQSGIAYYLYNFDCQCYASNNTSPRNYSSIRCGRTAGSNCTKWTDKKITPPSTSANVDIDIPGPDYMGHAGYHSSEGGYIGQAWDYFKMEAVDYAGNKSTATEEAMLICSKPSAPTKTQMSYSTKIVKP